MKALWGLAAVGMLAACSSNGNNGGSGGGGGGSSSSSVKYALVEASGEVSVVASNSSCNTQTTSSVIQLAMPLMSQTTGATFVPSNSSLFLTAQIQVTIQPRVGTTQCSLSGNPIACPTYADKVQTFSSFLDLKDVQPEGKSGATQPAELIPFVSLQKPALCDNGSYDLSNLALQANPIPRADLLAGRFVLEGHGTAPIAQPASTEGVSADVLTGTFRYDYRFVFQSSTYDPSKPAADAGLLTTWAQCSQDDEPTEASLTAAIDAYKAQGKDLALNPSGCRRIKITTSGSTTTYEQVVITGTLYTVDPTSGALTTAPDQHTTYVREEAPNVVRDRGDFDHDGFFEATNEWTFDTGGAWLKLVSQGLEKGTSAVLDQVTMTPNGVDQLHVVVERRIAGALAIEREYDTAREQQSCFNPGAGGGAGGGTGGAGGAGGGAGCTGAVLPCTVTERNAILARMARVLPRGRDCLEQAGFKTFDFEGKPLTLIATDKLNFKCNHNPCGDYGSFDPTQKAGGIHDFTVNVAKTGAGTQTLLDSTVFHEMLHSDGRFSHDPGLVEAAYKAGKLQMVDRTYACETMCFSATVDACTCIRCLDPEVSEVLDKDICTKCEAKYGSTKGCKTRYEKGADGLMHPVAQSVGAWCKGSQTFCDTKAECDTGCVASSGSNCMPVRATCDDTCN